MNIQWYLIAYTIYSKLFNKALVAYPPLCSPQPQGLLWLGHQLHSAGTVSTHFGCSHPHCLFVQLFCCITATLTMGQAFSKGFCTLSHLILTDVLRGTQCCCSQFTGEKKTLRMVRWLPQTPKGWEELFKAKGNTPSTLCFLSFQSELIFPWLLLLHDSSAFLNLSSAVTTLRKPSPNPP